MKDGEVKNKLSPAQVSVMQHRVTEPPYFGKYWDHFESGQYRCAACDTPLFSSEDKFNAKTGWPSFKKPLNERDMQFKSEPGPDDKVEIRCKKCKSHLGYVIAGDTPYYRINSVCMNFEARIPVVSNIAPKTNPTPTVAESVIVPSESETSPPPALGSMIVGLLIGLVVGAGAMAYYREPTEAALPEIASSTAETATTTIEAPVTDETPIDLIPEPILSDEPPVSTIPPAGADTLGTSTQ